MNTLSSAWRPFTQMKTARTPIRIVRGEGAYLYAEDGTPYLDAISSWWTCLHAHNCPALMEALRNQTTLLDHVMFSDFTHPPAEELCELLLELLPEVYKTVFFVDNGSTAVEAAIKMAIQQDYNMHGKSCRKKIIAFRNGYHGDTLGAMSVGDRGPFTAPFLPYLFDVTFIDPPLAGQEQSSLDQMQHAINKNDIIAFIFEPLVQGSGGMIMYSPQGLDPLLELCHSNGVVTIADEVMTGFGRTGPVFACETLKHPPDMMCLSKGITGGVMALGAVVCKEWVFSRFYADERSKAFLHGHSYTGNPLACSVAVANLKLLKDPLCLQQRARIEASHRAQEILWEGHPKLKNCRVTGTILAVEIAQDQSYSYFNPLRDALHSYYLEAKVILRPLGNIVYILPPYCVSQDELQRCYAVIEQSAKEVL